MRVSSALRFTWVIPLAMVVKDASMFVIKFCEYEYVGQCQTRYSKNLRSTNIYLTKI